MPADRFSRPISKHSATKPYILSTVLPSYGVTDLFDWSGVSLAGTLGTNSLCSTQPSHSTDTTSIGRSSRKQKRRRNPSISTQTSNAAESSLESPVPLFWPSRASTPARRGTSEVPLHISSHLSSPMKPPNSTVLSPPSTAASINSSRVPSIPIPTVPIYGAPGGPCSVPVRSASARTTPLRSSYPPPLESPISIPSTVSSSVRSTPHPPRGSETGSVRPDVPNSRGSRRWMVEDSSESYGLMEGGNFGDDESESEEEPDTIGRSSGTRLVDGVVRMVGPKGEVEWDSEEEEDSEEEDELESDGEDEDESDNDTRQRMGVSKFIDNAAQVSRGSNRVAKSSVFRGANTSQGSSSSSQDQEDSLWNGAGSGPISFRRKPRNVAVLTPGTWSYSGDGVSRQPVHNREVGDIHFSPAFAGGQGCDYWVYVDTPTCRWAQCMEGQAHPVLDGYVLKPRSGKLPPQWILAQSLRAGKSRERKRANQ